jgi:predicted PurR-regulated permease PerM
MSKLPPTIAQRHLLWLALTGLAAATIVALVGAACWGLGLLLDVLGPVLWPLAVAGVVACVLSPLVDWLESEKRIKLPGFMRVMSPLVRWVQGRKLPRPRAIILVFVVVFALAAGVLASVVPQVVVETQELIAKIPEYSTRLQHRIAELMAQPPEFLRQFLPAPPKAEAAAVNDKEKALTSALGLLGAHWSGVGSWLFSQKGKLASSVGILAGLVLIPVYAFYFLLETRKIKDHWKDYLPVRDSTLKVEVVFVLDAISQYLVAFFRGQVLVALCDSILYTIGFLSAGLNYAFLLGFAAVLLSMIPFLGAIVLFLAAETLALVQFGDWLHPVIILCVFGVVQTLESLVISPKIIGDRVGLHPLVIIIAVMTGTTLLGGILGGILAIPLAAALRVILFRYVWKVKET